MTRASREHPTPNVEHPTSNVAEILNVGMTNLGTAVFRAPVKRIESAGFML